MSNHRPSFVPRRLHTERALHMRRYTRHPNKRKINPAIATRTARVAAFMRFRNRPQRGLSGVGLVAIVVPRTSAGAARWGQEELARELPLIAHAGLDPGPALRRRTCSTPAREPPAGDPPEGRTPPRTRATASKRSDSPTAHAAARRSARSSRREARPTGRASQHQGLAAPASDHRSPARFRDR
jgi:hypothetical protein